MPARVFLVSLYFALALSLQIPNYAQLLVYKEALDYVRTQSIPCRDLSTWASADLRMSKALMDNLEFLHTCEYCWDEFRQLNVMLHDICDHINKKNDIACMCDMTKLPRLLC